MNAQALAEHLGTAAWPTAFVLPLALALGTIPRPTRAAAISLTPTAALPALLLALFGEVGEGGGARLPYVLIGMELGLTEVTRVFLLFTALLWTVAAVYALGYTEDDPRRGRFFAFFLLTMAGNLGLIIARDLASFYLFFSLMSFLAYGVIVHEDTERARRAASVYLVMTVFGEACVLPAVLITAGLSGTVGIEAAAAALADSGALNAVVLLATLGFGVKAGAVLLHLWLPLAHPAAPTPASAVLSGTMIKAGLLGWMLLIPVGEVSMPAWGVLFMAFGLLAAFYGVLVGVTQSDPKTVLAYSSISQMGFMTAALGAALAVPGAWPVAALAVPIYATHHALAKGVLFLGVGVARKVAGLRDRSRRLLVVAGLLFASLAMAGGPLTSGAAAKEYLKEVAYLAPGGWENALLYGFDLAAVGTAVVMGRFLFSVWPEGGEDARPVASLALPWAFLLGALATSVLFLPVPRAELSPYLLGASAFWPVSAGALIVAGAWYLDSRSGGRLRERLMPGIPEGDLIVPVTRVLRALRGLWKSRVGPSAGSAGERLAALARRYESGSATLRSAAQAVESGIRLWTVAGALALLLALAVLTLSVLA